MSARATWLLLAGVVVLTAGCIEPFEGSRLSFNLVGARPPCMAIKALDLQAPASWKGTCNGKEVDDRVVHHYEIWATLDRSAVVHLGHFTVQRHLFADEQIQFEKAGVRLPDGAAFRVVEGSPFASLPAAEQQEARAQMNKAQEVYAMTGYAPRKLQADGKTLHPDLYVGSHLQLTRPHNGTYYGQVQSKHPYGTGTLGGGFMNVAPALERMDSIFVTIEDGAPDRKDRKPSGLIYLQGTARRVARGVINVEATSPHAKTISGSFAVQTGLDEEAYF